MLIYSGVLAVFGGASNLKRAGPGTLEFYNGNSWVIEPLNYYRDFHAMVLLPCQTTTNNITSMTATMSSTTNIAVSTSTTNNADKTAMTMGSNETTLPKMGVLLLGGKSDLGPVEYIKQVKLLYSNT